MKDCKISSWVEALITLKSLGSVQDVETSAHAYRQTRLNIPEGAVSLERAIAKPHRGINSFVGLGGSMTPMYIY
jgi:hypothetical protein